MERKFFVGGNWKMNGSKANIDGILKTLAEGELSPSTGLCSKWSQIQLAHTLPNDLNQCKIH